MAQSFMRLRKEDPFEKVLFFDLDNTLYSKSHGIAEEMGQRIRLFFEQHLALPTEESERLGRKYYLDYGLAIKGLIKNFSINPQDYDEFVDGGLELERKLKPDIQVIRMIRRVNARRWIFTNAGQSHTLRTLKLLGVMDLFEGIIYCDYSEPDFPAKPDQMAYERAMQCAGISDARKCYFIDDNQSNVMAARELGWNAICLDEQGDQMTSWTVKSLLDLPAKFPQLFPI